MGGFIFRVGVRLKDMGERLRWDWLIRLGLRIREYVLQHGVVENGKIKVE